jgi:putative redox protein
MVTCVNKNEKYHSVISNGNVSIECDNPVAYGGAGVEFGPHDFIEAGYAACLNVGTRKICERENIDFEEIKITVALDYHDDEKMYIRHKIEIKGVPDDVAKDIAEREFANCLVKRNLSKQIIFEPLAE